MAAKWAWTPKEAREWISLLKYPISYSLATLLVVYATFHATKLGVSLVAAFFGTATVFLGLPHVLRLDREDSSDE